MKNISTTMIVIAVAVGAAGFFGGMKFEDYQTAKNRTDMRGQFQAGGMNNTNGNRAGGQRAGFRPVNGDIIASDEKSITVKMQDGSSRIVILNDKTQINKADVALKTDLKVGEKVAVFGTDNADGSVTAQNVQLNPILRGMTGTSSATQR
jgi:hypothetical protein